MTEVQLPETITQKKIQAGDLLMNVLFSGDENDTPVILMHGNFAAALYWVDVMLSLPEGFRGIAPDLRGFGWTEDKLIDATQGAKVWSDDIINLMDALNIEKAHVVGWSLSAGIVYKLIADHSDRILSATLEAPAPPYGMGGTDIDGNPITPDFAGSGAGVVNQDFIKQAMAGDRTADTPASPRFVMNNTYYADGFRSEREEDFLTASLMEKMGEKRYPGDWVESENWPYVAPGKWGPINAITPKYMSKDVPAFINAENKPPILWLRGAKDVIVGDNTLYDMAILGKLGYKPDYPGEENYPPQFMVSQTRRVFEKYGNYKEVVLEEAAHAIHSQFLDKFNQEFHKHLKSVK